MADPCFYRVSVKGLAVNAVGHVLLALEDNGLWDLPGGGLEHNEDPIAGLKREIHEETGLEVVSVSNTPKCFLTSTRHGHDDYTANVIYEIELKNLEFIPSDECRELRYCSIEDMRQMPLYPNVTKLLEIIS
ncbi:MAG: 8-oxo-dGTP diphosphatase [Patescibacteria group bacterium]|nr:8-oxo-dGTP diphosphatase [Patescibacteria group bacterium]